MAYRVDKQGPVTVPTSTVIAAGGSLETVFDPTISALLTVFKSVINGKLDAAWTKAATNISNHAVEDVYPYEPLNPAANTTWSWPALFMWREEETLFKRTQVWDDVETKGKLAYVLPPLTYELIPKLAPIRTAVRVVLHSLIEHFGDPEYLAGANIILARSLESFEWKTATYGFLPASAGLEQLHPTLEFAFEMRERQEWVLTQYSDMTSIATILEVKSETTTTGVDLVSMTYDPTA